MKLRPANTIENPSSGAMKDLQRIPGVGPSIAKDLIDLGVNSVSELKDKNPEMLYQLLCDQQGKVIDRCVLYVFRCAVYFASCLHSGEQHDPEKLKWWYWKNHE